MEMFFWENKLVTQTFKNKEGAPRSTRLVLVAVNMEQRLAPIA